MAQKKAGKPAQKTTTAAKSKKAVKTVKPAAKKAQAPVKAAAAKKAKPVEMVKAKPTAKPKSEKIAAPVVTPEVAAPAPKQTRKQALLESKPDPAPLAEDKEIKKAKKALGRAKQSLAKARAKDFGSKLGKNLINQGMDELTKKWESLFKKSEGIESKPYRMKDSFEERTAIEHKILGWGFVLSNQNDRLEVLFRDGIRYLISNYKS